MSFSADVLKRINTINLLPNNFAIFTLNDEAPIGKFQCCVRQLEIEDIAPIKKLRVGHNGKGRRSDWYLEKVSNYK